MRIFSGGLSLLLLSLGGVLNAQAEVRQMPWEASPPPRLVEDRLRIEVGLWNVGMDTYLRADATSAQPGTTLDGESDVGLADSRLMPDIELTLLPGKRHLLRVNGFSSRRNGSAVLTRDVQFDGNDYFAGDLVKSTLNLDMLGVGYAYRLFKTPRYELDIGADVQITAVEANVYVPRRGIREADDGVLPIPMLDAEARWEVWPRWQLLARYRWLGDSGNNGEVKGRLADWRVGVQWQFSQHLGLGLHYRSFGIQVDSASTNHPGALRLDYQGVQLAFRASM
ncbi:MAG: hypothetical protein AB7T07_13240 [Steroidobacteraceae bacterium]